MSNKNMTAVEWLLDQIQQKLYIRESVIEQAKEMDKEQKANTWNNAINAVEKDKWESFEQYYKETYEQ
jgi:hypothetical protein